MDALIIDYAMGNLRSVLNALNAVDCESEVSSAPADARRAKRIVLPGVGAFGDGMHNLERAGWLDVLDDEVRRRGKPFLGLCLGMQLLAERGTEYGDHAGLGWIPGVVERLPAEGVRVPHIGWNDVQIKASSRLGSGLGDSATFYFVHSYVLKTDAEDAITGRCLYGSDFPVMLEHENVFGTQFHPEKSQRDGLTILRNFARC